MQSNERPLSRVNINAINMGTTDPKERVKHLSKFGNIIEVDKNIPVTRYYRSGTEMLRMAQVYHSEGNLENAYILYMKYMTLFLEKIRSHPDFPTIKTEVKALSKRIKEEVMPTTEKLRKKLLDRYTKEYERFLSIQVAREVERERQEKLKARQGNSGDAGTSSSLIPANLHVQMDPNAHPGAFDMELLDHVVYPNDFPSCSNRTNFPSSGLLLVGDQEKDSGGAEASTSARKPAFDRSQKPQYDRSDSLLAGSLRTVIIPHDTMEVFLRLAQKNTTNNVETCGILAGHLAHNKLFITHVIIPKQQGTANSCITMHEEEIFDVQDQQSLITLGWIHTHPSQTAFLSSVDLHTHCSYQMMMPEAIAIVCAPKYHATGFYILTPSHGIDLIAQCSQTGFHPHPNEPPLFMEAQHIKVDTFASIVVVDLRR